MANSICTKVIITSVFLILFIAGLAEVILASLNLDKCPTESSLPVWMIVSGSMLILVVILSMVYISCDWLDYTRRSQNKFKSPTILALYCGCCWGGIGVLLFLTWLAIWISGTYFFITAVREIRVSTLNEDQQCDISLVILSGATILFIWSLFIFLVLWLIQFIVRLSNGNISSHNGKSNNSNPENHIYDQVATDP